MGVPRDKLPRNEKGARGCNVCAATSLREALTRTDAPVRATTADRYAANTSWSRLAGARPDSYLQRASQR